MEVHCFTNVIFYTGCPLNFPLLNTFETKSRINTQQERLSSFNKIRRLLSWKIPSPAQNGRNGNISNKLSKEVGWDTWTYYLEDIILYYVILNSFVSRILKRGGIQELYENNLSVNVKYRLRKGLLSTLSEGKVEQKTAKQIIEEWKTYFSRAIPWFEGKF